MSFQDAIATMTAAEIVAAVGCPRQTAYSWLSGDRLPPAWVQALLVPLIEKAEKRRR